MRVCIMVGRVVGGGEGGRIMLASSRGADEGDEGEICLMEGRGCLFPYFKNFLLWVDFNEVPLVFLA